MALKVKAVERLLKFDKEKEGKYRYVLSPDLYSSLDQDKVIKEAASRSGVMEGVMQACWNAAGEVIKAWATEGHSVAIPGLGTMRFGLRGKAVENVNEVKAGLITTRRIIFTPTVKLKEELANTAIQITLLFQHFKELFVGGLGADGLHVGEDALEGFFGGAGALGGSAAIEALGCGEERPSPAVLTTVTVEGIHKIFGNDTGGHLQAGNVAIELTTHLRTGETTLAAQLAGNQTALLL